MTTHDDRPPTPDTALQQHAGAMPAPVMPATGPGNAFPATASGVPLSVFAFGFAVGILGLVDTGILNGAAVGVFIAVAMGTGAAGLLIGGLWDFRGGNLFAGTFGTAYALFLFTTGLILKFFAPSVIASAGANAFGDAFGAWLILWAIFTAGLAVGARTINLPAFLAFVLLAAVYVILAIASLGGAAGWAGTVTKMGGWVALADGVAAWYLGFGILLNTTVGKDLLPLWPYHPAQAAS
ncbi:MAG: acetate uptake transporter [Micromonosporaceae bacterium]